MRADYAGVWHVAPSGYNKGPALLEIVVDHWPTHEDKAVPPEVAALAQATPGYGVFWSPRRYAPPRRWSKEARARERVRRLRERIERKYPLFAEQFIAEALAARAAYYRAEDAYYDVGRE